MRTHKLKYRDLKNNSRLKNTRSEILKTNMKSWLSWLLAIAKGFQPHTTKSRISKHNRFLWSPRGWKLGLQKQKTRGPQHDKREPSRAPSV